MLRRLVLYVVLAVALTHISRLVLVLGYFKTIHNHRPGPCRVVDGIAVGSEDITVSGDGLAFISSGLRGKNYYSDPRLVPPFLEGKISLFDFNHPENNAVELPVKGNFDRENFYPHGISLYEDPKTGERRLFAVNHHLATDEDRVEIFLFDDKTRSLNHLKTVTGKNMYSLNDLVAIGPETFYFSNDQYYVKNWLRELEVLSLVSWGTVGLYSNGEDRIVASGFRNSNGVNVSPDGRYLYVAQPTAGSIVVFEIKEDHSLEKIQTILVHTGVDNIEVDKKTGDLWLGCHPSFHLWVDHTKNVTNPAGSQVLRVHFESKSAPYEKVDIRQVFMDDGNMVSGASSASYYDNKLLVGTVIHKMAYCEIKAF
ncbi:serum paraoxonase/arylesterase 1-like [Ptychodera flava]|uniref:serum paraoxonase/arylesterase 1-like n=1 Tax=Ptychodera flava TaxID=63121 RepID=UPI003969BC4E